MKRNIEIDDTLQGNVDDAISEVREELERYLEENKPDSLPDLGDLDYSGAIHEIVDGCVPIHTKEIEDTWYLHAYELEKAYEDAGVGQNPRENNGMAAIYYYIDQKVREWYANEAEDIFEAWKERAEETGEKEGLRASTGGGRCETYIEGVREGREVERPSRCLREH